MRGGRFFSVKDIDGICRHIHMPLHSPPAAANDFRIRHRRIFTLVILRQIEPTVYSRRCARCLGDDEDFEHLFLYCPAYADFRAYMVERVLRGREADSLWLFGVCGCLSPPARRPQPLLSTQFLLPETMPFMGTCV